MRVRVGECSSERRYWRLDEGLSLCPELGRKDVGAWSGMASWVSFSFVSFSCTLVVGLVDGLTSGRVMRHDSTDG